MFCGTCGGEVPAGAQSCASCGTPVQAAAPGDEPTFRAPTVATTSSAPVAPGARNSTLSIVSLVLGVAGVCIPVVAGLAAIITGHLARSEIRRSGGALGGAGMALAGLVLGYATTLFMCLILSIGLVRFSEKEAHLRESATAAMHEDAGLAQAIEPEEPLPPPPAGTSLVLSRTEVTVDGAPVEGLGSLAARASTGVLPPLLTALRARQQAVPTDTVRIQVADDVRFGLLQRVLETAQGVPYTSLALLDGEEEAEPRFLWDGKPGLELPKQAALTATLSGSGLLLQREQRAPVRVALRRDEEGVWEMGPLDEALGDITEELPEQQTLMLRVADDVLFEDLIEVLDACTYAGFTYVALRSSGR